MKTAKILFAAALFFIIGNLHAQEKEPKTKVTVNSEFSRIEKLINSKNFEFMANTAFSTNGASKNLVGSNYSIMFSEELISSYLPFYGTGYAGMALQKDTGMRFQGNPEVFTISKKEKEYEIDAVVKTENDTFSISINVSASGYANLSISSNNRGTMSYQGEIGASGK